MTEINASPGRVLQIGYESEDNVTNVIFRYDEEWLSYGAGEFKIRVKRPCDTEAYNATQIVDDREAMTLTMTITDVELSVKGHGEMQVVYIGADFVKKSPIYRYNVSRAIDSEVVNPPQGSIINELVQTVAGIGGRLATAETTLTEKADKSYVDTELSGKANSTDIAIILANVTEALSDIETALAGKASMDVATQSANGLMSAMDKAKLDNVGSVVTVSGTTPTITALSGVRYVCGEVSTLDITPCASGICDVVFTSGSTATVLALPNTVKFPDGAFTPEVNTTYEINILDGIYGAVMAWT